MINIGSLPFPGNLKNVDIASLLKQGATIKEEIRNKANTTASSNSNTNTSTSMYQTGFNTLRKRSKSYFHLQTVINLANRIRCCQPQFQK